MSPHAGLCEIKLAADQGAGIKGPWKDCIGTAGGRRTSWQIWRLGVGLQWAHGLEAVEGAAMCEGQVHHGKERRFYETSKM